MGRVEDELGRNAVDPPDEASLSARADGGVVFWPEHRLQRAASPTRSEETEPSHPVRRRRVARDFVIFAFALLVGAAIQPFADLPNPEYPEAREIADRLDSAWRSVANDGVDPAEAAETAELNVYFYEVNERVRTVFTHPEPTEAGHCYTVRRGPWIGTEAGILEAPVLRCTPQPPGLVSETGSWEEVLPSQRITTVWYVPVMVLLSGIALYAATDIPLALLTRSP